MSDLYKQGCEPCRSGAQLASAAEIEQYRQQIPDWSIAIIDDVRRLTRSYKFKNFRQALAFSNRVGAIAEAEQHHPAILTEWGQVTVSWWTHKIGGLHRNDFIMAAKTDQLLADD